MLVRISKKRRFDRADPPDKLFDEDVWGVGFYNFTLSDFNELITFKCLLISMLFGALEKALQGVTLSFDFSNCNVSHYGTVQRT